MFRWRRARRGRTAPAEAAPGDHRPQEADEPAPIEVRLELYRRMVELRAFAQRGQDDATGGERGLGREAIAAGFGLAMEAVDYCAPSCRCGSHARACGAPVTELPAGVHPSLASGAAWSARLRCSGQVVVCFVAHGAASAAATVEALELAGPCRLPVVFVYEHDLDAADGPGGAARAGRAVAPVLSLAGGSDPVVVDGDDADAVYAAAVSVLARARSGGGPSLVEALTSRHVGDPIRRLRDRLEAAGIPAQRLDRLEDEAARQGAVAPGEEPSLGLVAAGGAGRGNGSWPR